MNPSSDIIDAYYICKYGFDKMYNSEYNDSDNIEKK